MYIRQAWNSMWKRYPVGGVLYLLVNIGLAVALPYLIWDRDWRVLLGCAAAWLVWAVLFMSVFGEWLVSWLCNGSAIPAVTKRGAVNRRRLRLYNMMQSAHRAFDEEPTTEDAYLLRLIRNTPTASVTAIGRHTIVISEKMLHVTPMHLEAQLIYAMLELRMGRSLAFLWLFAANAPITLCLIAIELMRKALGLLELFFMNLSPRVTGKGFRIVDRVLAVPLTGWCVLSSLFFAVGMRRFAEAADEEAQRAAWGDAWEASCKVMHKFPTDNPLLRSLSLMQLPTDRLRFRKR